MSEIKSGVKETAPKGRMVRNTEKLKHVCVRVNDPKNEGNKTEYTIVRVPMPVALDMIQTYGAARAWFVAKKTYKNFIRTINKRKVKGNSISVGLTHQEIRHCAILKKEIAKTAKLRKTVRKNAKAFTFPIFNDDDQDMLTSDLRDFEREQKVKDDVHNRGNNRKRTKSRKGNVGGSYVYGGFRVHASNGNYKKVAQVHAMQESIKSDKAAKMQEDLISSAVPQEELVKGAK